MHPQMPTHQRPPAPHPAPRPPLPYYNPPFPGPPPAGMGRPPLSPAPPPAGPNALWIVFSWSLCVMLGLSGMIGMGLGALSVMRDAAPGQAFASGEWVEITVNPGDEPPVIYATSATPADIRCDIRSRSGPRPALLPATDFTTVRDGYGWEVAFHVDGAGPGTYQLTCESDVARFGVGTRLDAARAAGAVLLGLLVMFGGLVAAIVTTISVVSRRRSARRFAPLLQAPVPAPRQPW